MTTTFTRPDGTTDHDAFLRWLHSQLEWQMLPYQRDVLDYHRRVARSPSFTRARLLPPEQRTPAAQATYVAVLGWHNPKAVNQYIREFNLFWQNIYRHDEERRVAEWQPSVRVIEESGEISAEAWDRLSMKAGDIEINPVTE